MKYFVTIGERVHEVDLVSRLGELIVTVNGEPMDLKYSEADRHGQVTLQHDDRSFGASIEGSDSEVSITLAGHSYQMQLEDERERAAHVAEQAASKGGGMLKAVMPGIVVETLVAVGEEVGEGQPLLILEAMKMQNEILAPGPGIVARFHVEPGQAVAAGAKPVDLKGLE